MTPRQTVELCAAFGFAAFTAGPRLASAQAPPPEPAEEASARRDDPWAPASGVGAAVLVGGGVSGFTARAADDRTGLAGAWALRIVSGTRRYVAGELAYTGSVSDVVGPGVTGDDYLMRNGVEGGLRLNAPFSRGPWLVSPFALAGIGWDRYSLVNAGPNVAGIDRNDDVLALPVGGGLAFGFRGAMLDLRCVYRPAFQDGLFDDAGLDTWMATASLGGEF